MKIEFYIAPRDNTVVYFLPAIGYSFRDKVLYAGFLLWCIVIRFKEAQK